MTGLKAHIEWQESRVSGWLEQQAKLESDINKLQARLDALRHKIVVFQADIAELKRELAQSPEGQLQPVATDVNLVALRGEPIREALEYLARKHGGQITLKETYAELTAAGFPIGDGAAVRSALGAGKIRGTWRPVGKGIWQMLATGVRSENQTQQEQFVTEQPTQQLFGEKVAYLRRMAGNVRSGDDLKCLRCGYEWQPYLANPLRCASSSSTGK